MADALKVLHESHLGRVDVIALQYCGGMTEDEVFTKMCLSVIKVRDIHRIA